MIDDLGRRLLFHIPRGSQVTILFLCRNRKVFQGPSLAKGFVMAQELPPRSAVLQMIHGYWLAQAIHVAAKLGVADLLKNGPKTRDELARATKTQPRALYRLLRALAS